MTAVELGTGYVSIVPSAKGIKKNLSKELGGPEMDKAASKAGDSAAKKFGGKFAAGLKLAGAAAGGALALGVGKGITDALNREAVNDRLSAQLGLTGYESEQAGRVAGELYTSAFGESREDVADQLANTIRTFGSGLSDEDLFGLTAGSIDLTAAFDVDPERLAQTTGVLVRTGLSDTAVDAQDIITAALQGVAAPAGDVLDTLYEFAEPLASLGITGATAVSVLSSAADAGVFDLTKAGDAALEFSIRAIDGSKATADAYKVLGLDADELRANIAAGGPAARESFGEVLTALDSIEDPLARDAAGVALFGETWEILGPQAISSLNPMGQSIDDVEGSTARLGDTLNDNLKTRLEELKRKGFEKLTVFAEERLLPVVERIIDYFESPAWANLKTDLENIATTLADTLQPVWDTFVAGLETAWNWGQDLKTWFEETPGAIEGLTVVVGLLAAGMLLYAGAALLGAIASIAVYLPILALIAVVGVLAGLFIWAYEEVDWFRAAVDDLKVAFEDVLPELEGVAAMLGNWLIPNLSTVTAQFEAAAEAVRILTDALSRLPDLGGIPGFSALNTIVDGVSGIGGAADRKYGRGGAGASGGGGAFDTSTVRTPRSSIPSSLFSADTGDRAGELTPTSNRPPLTVNAYVADARGLIDMLNREAALR